MVAKSLLAPRTEAMVETIDGWHRETIILGFLRREMDFVSAVAAPTKYEELRPTK